MSHDPDHLQRIARLTPLADVLARIDALVKPVKPREVEIAAAVGRVAAGDMAVRFHPRVPLALRDGWAVSAELTVDAGPYTPVPLPAAVWIDTGQPIPAGTDAVALPDVVVRRQGQIGVQTEITAPIGVGEGVLAIGADADGRASLVSEGRRVTSIAAAALAAAEVTQLYVCEPRVRLARARPAPDAVIDAATDLLARQIEAAGGRVLRAENMPLDDALRDDTADAVIVIGGTGSGRNDRSVKALAQAGRIDTHGIAVSPGETAAVGAVGKSQVLLLPGRLDAALAVWQVIGRRLLARLAGSQEEEPTIKAKLAHKIASSLGLAEFVPIRVHDGAAEPIASGYVPLTALAQADGWLLVPPESEGYPAGSEVVIRAMMRALP
jgi:molybdopterin molybdotransferase